MGLTGSIGMGKSATAGMFRRVGVPVHDSDAAVRALYNGPNAQTIGEMFPGAVYRGQVDRDELAKKVLNNPAALKKLEEFVHPIVADDRSAFIMDAALRGEPIIVLDIPLLFEVGGLSVIDTIVVVSAPWEVQRLRVLGRPGMTEERFRSILAKQWPDSKKRGAAHFVVETGFGLLAAEQQVHAFLRAVANT